MKRVRCAVIGLALALTEAGCREEEPAERAGREADEALAKMKRAVENR